MLDTHFITTLLDLPDVFISSVDNRADAITICLEMPRSPHCCPNCQTVTQQVHDYRFQRIKDIPLDNGKPLYLQLRKRRYRCPACGKRFYEDVPFLARFQRRTNRFFAHLVASFAEMHSASAIASRHFCSPSAALRAFDIVKYPKPAQLPPILSLDEFRGNAGGEKFQCILADPKAKKVLDILPSRNSEELCAYFMQYPLEMRKKVKKVVIDMSTLFRSVINRCFPKARIIVDRFHAKRLVLWALEAVRKEEQKMLSTKYFKKSKYLLLKNRSKLSEEETKRLVILLDAAPKLKQAYRLKELFAQFLESSNRTEAVLGYKKWQKAVMETGIEQFNKCAITFGKWYQEIIDAAISPYSNGYIEGCNNRTKVLKRISFGVRNFERFRNRLLYIANNRSVK